MQVCLKTVILPCFVASQGPTRPTAIKTSTLGNTNITTETWMCHRYSESSETASIAKPGYTSSLATRLLPDWNNSRNPSHKRSLSALSAMLQHQALKASGLHCTRTSVSGGRFAAGPRTAGNKSHRRRLSIKTFSGLAAVQGPSFESLDSDDLLSPLATGVSVVVTDWCRRL